MSATTGIGRAEETRWVAGGRVNTRGLHGRRETGWNDRNGRLMSSQYASFFPLTTYGPMSVSVDCPCRRRQQQGRAGIATRPTHAWPDHALCGPRRSAGSRARNDDEWARGTTDVGSRTRPTTRCSSVIDVVVCIAGRPLLLH
jgi:hypothetical protein